MKHKLICWGDYAIPVDNEFNWMAWDKNGAVYCYESEPKALNDYWDYDDLSIGIYEIGHLISDIPPPEPGPWDQQLYNIE